MVQWGLVLIVCRCVIPHYLLNSQPSHLQRSQRNPLYDSVYSHQWVCVEAAWVYRLPSNTESHHEVVLSQKSGSAQ